MSKYWYEEMEEAEQEYESKLEDEALEYARGYEQGRADERFKTLTEVDEYLQKHDNMVDFIIWLNIQIGGCLRKRDKQ